MRELMKVAQYKLSARLVVAGLWLGVIGILIVYFAARLLGAIPPAGGVDDPGRHSVWLTLTQGVAMFYRAGVFVVVVGGLLAALGGIVAVRLTR